MAEIKNISEATVFVNPAVDHIEFSGGVGSAAGTTWTLTAPNGIDSITFQRGQSGAATDDSPEDWRLDGTRISGGDTFWTVVSNTITSNTPADGTWTFSFAPTAWSSLVSVTSASTPPIFLHVAGRGIEHSFIYLYHHGASPLLWNWHVGSFVGIHDFGAGVGGGHVQATQDHATNAYPEEDPNLAVYFTDQEVPEPGQDTAPIAITGHFTTVPSSNATEINGIWFGADAASDNEVRFYYADGNHTSTLDPSTIPGVQTTTQTNVGSNPQGTHQASINRDPTAGTTYWFHAENALGESYGRPVLIPGTAAQVGDADADVETLPATPGADPSTEWLLGASHLDNATLDKSFGDSFFVVVEAADWTAEADLRGLPSSTIIPAGDPPNGGNWTTTAAPQSGQTTSEPASGLTPATGYVFQIIGEYEDLSLDLGQVLPFTTTVSPSATQPEDDQVVTLQATNISEVSAVLNGAYGAGTVHGDELEAVNFIWAAGNHAAETDLRNVVGFAQTSDQTPPSPPGLYDQSVAGLAAGTVYTFQAFGERTSDQAWEALGSPVLFTTQEEVPNTEIEVTPVATTATDVDQDSATLNGSLTNPGTQSATRDIHFEYATGYDPASDTLQGTITLLPTQVGVVVGGGATVVVTDATGDVLTPLTTYYYRIVVEDP